MQPKITGICLYPLYQWVDVHPPGMVPTGHTIGNVLCSTMSEVGFANAIRHNLVCAGNADGDFFNIYVTGRIVKKTGTFSEPVQLDEFNMDKQKVGADGSNRVLWEWPNRVGYREIGATYEVNLTLLDRKNRGASPPEVQGPFTVKLLTPPPPKPINVPKNKKVRKK